jgi:hypothetical protein
LAVAGLTMVWIGSAQAAKTEEQCQSLLYKASGAYLNCQAKAQAKFAVAADTEKFLLAASKCRVKYASNWPKLQKKFAGSGTTCDQNRFAATFTIVTDHLTGLTWEKKDNTCPGVHCVNTLYSWSTAGASADGTAFTEVISALNAECLEGQCDWRLPNREELQTIMSDPYNGSPCATPACVDPAFGPAKASGYWSASSDNSVGDNAWAVLFSNGGMSRDRKSIPSDYVRAVRGGM